MPQRPKNCPTPTAGFPYVCAGIVDEYMQQLRAKIARFWRSFSHTCAPPPCGVHHLKYPEPPQAMVACPHVLGPPLAGSETLWEDMYINEVTKCPLAGTRRQLPHRHGPLSKHAPLGDIPALSTEAFIYGVVVNHNLHT